MLLLVLLRLEGMRQKNNQENIGKQQGRKVIASASSRDSSAARKAMESKREERLGPNYTVIPGVRERVL